MANLRKCSRCKSEIDISYFGMSRKKEPYKTCDNCRNKNKTEVKQHDRGISRFDITEQHYANVDNELRAKYENEFKKDSRDDTMRLFTEEEQVDRYAKMLLFWDVNRPSIRDMGDVISDPNLAAKVFYISDMRSQVHKAIMEKFDERVQKLIGDKYKHLAGCHNEQVVVDEFIKRHKYPTFKQVLNILSKDLHIYAEYGEPNHEWMKKIWSNIHDRDRAIVVGKLIDNRGGFQAMTNNHAALMKVVRYFLKQDELSEQDTMTIMNVIYKNVESAWHGIGQWLC